MGPSQRKEAVTALEERGVSKVRACAIVGQCRRTLYHARKPKDDGELGLRVRPRRKRKVNYVRGNGVAAVTRPNERWSIDFMHDRIGNYRNIRSRRSRSSAVRRKRFGSTMVPSSRATRCCVGALSIISNCISLRPVSQRRMRTSNRSTGKFATSSSTSTDS